MIIQRIRKRNGSIVAFIVDKGEGVQCIQKSNGSLVAWYHPSSSGGKTTDKNGKILGYGNMLASLVDDSW
jgi:hypothetical protein